MLAHCTRPCGSRALEASKLRARALDLSHFTKVNAHLLTSNLADVVVSNRHQRLDELLIFLPTLYRKSAKLFTRKLC